VQKRKNQAGGGWKQEKARRAGTGSFEAGESRKEQKVQKGWDR